MLRFVLAMGEKGGIGKSTALLIVLDYLIRAVQETVPLSVTMKEQIQQLRAWAENRAVSATAREDRESAPDENGTPRAAQGGRIVDFKL